jgi:hypothetical protein
MVTAISLSWVEFSGMFSHQVSFSRKLSGMNFQPFSTLADKLEQLPHQRDLLTKYL